MSNWPPTPKGNSNAISWSTNTGNSKSDLCPRHTITYYACPVCEAEKAMEVMRRMNKELQGKMDLLTEENRRLRSQVDVVSAIREALPLIGDDDLLFLKTVLYTWKADRSVSLKVTHGAKGRSRRKADRSPNGFIAMHRKADPEGYLCTSMGGLAVAEYFEEALNTVGSAQAMALLVRAMAKHLPGATDD